MLGQPENKSLAKTLDPLVWVLTVVVYVVVMTLHNVHFPLPEGVSLNFLPAFNAICNSLVSICLIMALVFVKQRKFSLHSLMIQVAMVLSALFLVSYIIYNATNPHTPHGGEGWVKTVYYILLLTHILLAAISLPFILKSYAYAVTNRFEKHKKMTRWVFPLWLFVAITGPICYLMISPYYA